MNIMEKEATKMIFFTVLGKITKLSEIPDSRFEIPVVNKPGFKVLIASKPVTNDLVLSRKVRMIYIQLIGRK